VELPSPLPAAAVDAASTISKAPGNGGARPGFNAAEPAIARVYNYWLEGKDHFAADREMADTLETLLPGLAELPRASRAFTGRAVRHVAEQGISQFADLGSPAPLGPAPASASPTPTSSTQPRCSPTAT
jgi:hypothetical protein